MNRELREGREAGHETPLLSHVARSVWRRALKGARQACIPHRHSSASFPHASLKRDLQHGREIAICHSDMISLLTEDSITCNVVRKKDGICVRVSLSNSRLGSI